MYHSFFIHSSVDGHLGCYHVLDIVSSATVNDEIHVSLSILVSSGYMPGSGITGSYGGFIPSFLRNLYTIFHQRIDAFELWCWRRLLRVPWIARRSNQSILKEIWVFIGKTDAEAKTPILRPPHAKSWLIGKDPDAGRGWGQEEKGMTEDELAGWRHRLDGHGFE